MKKKYFTIKEAAELLGVTPLTLRNWDKSGKLPAGRNPLNNYRVYRREDIEELVGEIETSALEEKAESTQKKEAKPRVKKLEVRHVPREGDDAS